jgi:hypothetical protein
MSTKIKTIMAFLTAMTMTAGTTLSVSATTALEDSDSIVIFDNGIENETDNGTVRYDLDNEAYIEKVKSYYGKIAMEDAFVEFLNSVGPKTLSFSDDGVNFTHSPAPIVKHIYKAREDFISPDKVSIVIEYSDTSNVRWFEYAEYYFENHMFRNNDDLVSKYTVNEINGFLKSQGFKAYLTKETLELYETSKPYYAMHYDDRSEENVFGAFLALNKKYGAIVSGCGLVTEEETFKDAVVTLIGDANGDRKVNVRDCACIANALANGEAESLPDNADYNQDTKKNVRDAASLSKDLAEK